MTTWSIFLFVCLIFIYHCHAQVTPVPICASPDGYDITALTKPTQWQLDLEGQCVNDTKFDEPCTFFFSFCHTLFEADKCVNASVCQWSMTRPDDIVSLAQYKYDPFIEKDVNGFYAYFEPGQTIINKYTNQSCQVSIQIEFDCDRNEPWASDGPIGKAPKPIEFSGIFSDSCNYFIKFPYAGACYRIITPSTSSPAVITTTPAIPDPTPEPSCLPPMGYDVETLIDPPYWIFKIDSGCSIEAGSPDKCALHVAFCKPFESLVGCQGASACILYPNQPGKSVIVGNYSIENPFTASAINGFAVDYPFGEVITNPLTNQTCTLSIQVILDCNSTAQWELDDKTKPSVAPSPISFSAISKQSCQINVTVPYNGACYKVKPGTPTGGLTTGTIFLIIILITVSMYLICGITYNKFVEKESGAKLIPHYDFWAKMMLNILDGVVYTWNLVTCKNSKKNNYDSI